LPCGEGRSDFAVGIREKFQLHLLLRFKIKILSRSLSKKAWICASG